MNQRIPLRVLTETFIGKPNTAPLVPGSAVAPNFGGSPATNPSGLQTNISLVGADAYSFSVTDTILSGLVGGVFLKTFQFPNLPVTQQSSSVNSPQQLPQFQFEPFYCPSSAVPALSTWAIISSPPSGANGNKLLLTALACSPVAKDTYGTVYSGSGTLTSGMTYNSFGATVSCGFYNPTGSPIGPTTYKITVYGHLFLTFPN